jgi:hypothetical protein
MPIATPNFRLTAASKDAQAYREPVPLDLDLCQDCGLLQIAAIGDAHTQFDNYVYTTSLSLGLVQHFRCYADQVVAAIRPEHGTLVVEIGSNDGTRLPRSPRGPPLTASRPFRNFLMSPSGAGFATNTDQQASYWRTT